MSNPHPLLPPDLLAGLDAPVRRHFTHAITGGAPLTTMSGRKVGLWLPFTAEQTIDGRALMWRARVGRGPLTPLPVIDRYADAAGSTEGRLLGRVRLFHADDLNKARSEAARAALESVVFAPASVLPDLVVAWRADAEDLIVACFDLPPERPEVRVRLDEHGATRTVRALPWGDAGQKPSSTSPAAVWSTPSAASATSCSPAASASAGGSTRRVTPVHPCPAQRVTPLL